MRSASGAGQVDTGRGSDGDTLPLIITHAIQHKVRGANDKVGGDGSKVRDVANRVLQFWCVRAY